MDTIHPYRPHALAGSRLDRIGHRRADADWVAARLHDPDSLFVPTWRSRNLFSRVDSGRPEAALLEASAAGPLLDDHIWALLGSLDGRIVFAIDLSSADQPQPETSTDRFEDLRSLGGVLEPEDAALLAHARGLMQWRTRHRFCGVCGAECVPHSAGNVMICQGCGVHHFPRTDPAVIMLVTRGDRALLGRPTRFPKWPVFTTLAGFVEPGETLEEAVAREVLEESGISVARVRYHSSQPWPFPASVMIGFYADGISEEITIDPAEIAEARWFSRDELRRPEGFVLPPDFSIARRLIDDWLDP